MLAWPGLSSWGRNTRACSPHGTAALLGVTGSCDLPVAHGAQAFALQEATWPLSCSRCEAPLLRGPTLGVSAGSPARGAPVSYVQEGLGREVLHPEALGSPRGSVRHNHEAGRWQVVFQRQRVYDFSLKEGAVKIYLQGQTK